MKKGKKVDFIIIAVLVILILLCMCYIAMILKGYIKGKDVYDNIKDIAYSKEVHNIDEEGVEDSKIKYYGVDLSLARKVNKDLISWIYIPDSNIDYPVVKGIDNSKYLDTLIDGSEGMNGTLFLDSRIEEYDKNLVIYGHNMKDGSMFHDLRNYEDKEWRDKHKLVYLSFEDFKPIEYEVVHVEEVRSSDDIYKWLITNDNKAYKWLRERVKDYKIDLSKRIVALSTCKGTGDIRILVLIQET